MADKSLSTLIKQADRQLGLFDRSAPPKPAPLPPRVSSASFTPQAGMIIRHRQHPEWGQIRVRGEDRYGNGWEIIDDRTGGSPVPRLLRSDLPNWEVVPMSERTGRDASLEAERAARVARAFAASPARSPDARLTTRTLKTISMSRYNGGVKAKRQYGSATITKFDVWDERWPRVIVSVDVGGASAGERTTAAKQRALPLLETELRKKGLL